MFGGIPLSVVHFLVATEAFSLGYNFNRSILPADEMFSFR